MDTRLSEYGWGGSADCSISELHEVVFDTGGILYSTNTFKTNKKKVRVSANFKYNDLDIGLILWYNNESGYMRFIANKDILFIERVIRGIPTIISQIPFDTLTPPANGDTITMEAELIGTNLKCYYNTTEAFNIEQSLFKQGYFGVYGSDDEKCIGFSVKSNTIGEWTRHISDATSIDKDGDYVRIIHNNPENPFVYISQDVDASTDGSYSISFDYIGSAHLVIANGETVLHEADFDSSETEKRASFSFDVAGIPVVTIEIGSDVQGVHLISSPQIEKKSFDTAYSNEARQQSLVTFPAQAMNKEFGGLALDIKPLHSYEQGTLPIFYYSDSINLIYQGGQFILSYGPLIKVIVDKQIEEGKWYYISSTWENTNFLQLDIWDGETHETNAFSIGTEDVSSSETLYIGCSPTTTGNLVIDNLVVYKNHVDLGTLLTHRENEEMFTENVVIKSNFNKNTFVYDKNKVALPVAKPNSPVIIETESGLVYKRVYFIDSGKYVTYNIEMHKYKDSKTFKIGYGDILKAEAFTYDMDKMFHDIATDGDRITIDDLEDADKGRTIVIKYTVKNTCAINYNDKYDQFEIEFSNTDGEQMTVYYDHPDGTDKKLVRSIQLNPFKSVNNSGFIFVEDTPRELETFDIKVTPDSLVADGFSTATITVDCLSESGIPTSNVEMEIQSVNGYGTIYRYVTEKEAEWTAYAEQHGEEKAIEDLGYLITDEHRAGRFIYKYKAGRFGYEEGQYEMVDNVIVRDTISGIGTQIPIRLVRES